MVLSGILKTFFNRVVKYKVNNNFTDFPLYKYGACRS